MSIQKININGSDVAVVDSDAQSKIGTLSNLSTSSRNNLVSAINELVSNENVLRDNISNVSADNSNNYSDIRGLIRTKLSDGVTVSVDPNKSSSFNVPLSVSGYTLVGIITFNITGSNSSNCCVQGVTINSSSTGATIRFKNLSTSKVNWTATAKGLFIRNDLVQ